MAPIPGFPRIDRLAGHAGQSILHALTPRTGEPSGVPQPQSFSDYWRSQAAAFDPRTASGAFNIAATFVPGPGGKGGKFVGPLTESQRGFLEKLNNIVARRVDPNPDWYASRGLEPEGSFNYALNQQQWSVLPSTRDKSVMDMVDLFGTPRGSPMPNVRMYSTSRDTSLPLNQQVSDQIDRANRKLGMVQDMAPDWLISKEFKDAYKPFYSREHGHTVADNMAYNDDAASIMAEAKDVERQRLAQIIRTIVRGQG